MKIGIMEGVTLFCLALLIIGVVATIREVSFLANAVETTGIIVGLKKEAVEGGYSYTAIFEFTDPRTGGKITRVNPISGGNYKVGEQVIILYDPNNPENAQIKGSGSLSFLLLWTSVVAVPTGFFVVLWFSVTRAPRTTAKHRVRHSRTTNFVIIGLTCLFVVPMLLLWFYIGINIWLILFLAILCTPFIILTSYIMSKLV